MIETMVWVPIFVAAFVYGGVTATIIRGAHERHAGAFEYVSALFWLPILAGWGIAALWVKIPTFWRGWLHGALFGALGAGSIALWIIRGGR